MIDYTCGFYAVNNKHCVPDGLDHCAVCNVKVCEICQVAVPDPYPTAIFILCDKHEYEAELATDMALGK